MSAETYSYAREERNRGFCFDWCGHRRAFDALDSIRWAFIFFWGSLVVLAEGTGYAAGLSWWGDGWGVFLAGAGIIVLTFTTLRLLLQGYRRRIVFGYAAGSALLVIGLGGGHLIWPLMFMAAGAAMLASALTGKNPIQK